MATRYAPNDPTLPFPWTRVIDGRTGLLYYWNPVTNVSQYERPATSLNVQNLTPGTSSLPVSGPSLPPISTYHTIHAPIMQVGGMGPQQGQQLMLGQSLQFRVGLSAQQRGQSVPLQQQYLHRHINMTQTIQQYSSQSVQPGQQTMQQSQGQRFEQGMPRDGSA